MLITNKCPFNDILTCDQKVDVAMVGEGDTCVPDDLGELSSQTSQY